MNNPKLLVLLTILFWSFGSLLTRLISIKSQLLSLNLLFLFSLVFFVGYFYLQYKKNFFKELKRIKLRYLVFGLFGYFFYYLGLVQSFHLYNNGSEAAILNYTFPIFTVIFTELIRFRHSRDLACRQAGSGKPVNKRNSLLYWIPVFTGMTSKKVFEYAGVLLGFIAVILLATKGDIFSFQIANLPAFLWGLSAGISYGIFSAYSSRVPKDDQSMFLLASIFSSWILALIISIPELKDLGTLTMKEYAVTGILAIVVNCFGFIAWVKANRLAHEQHISISTVASFMFILPFLNLFVISIVLHETFLFQTYFLTCLGLLMASAVLSQRAEQLVRWFKKK